MKSRKLTPFLIICPLEVILFVFYICSTVWTPFSLIFIIGFTVIASLLMFLDRFLFIKMDQKAAWIAEFSILLALILLYFIHT